MKNLRVVPSYQVSVGLSGLLLNLKTASHLRVKWLPHFLFWLSINTTSLRPSRAGKRHGLAPAEFFKFVFLARVFHASALRGIVSSRDAIILVDLCAFFYYAAERFVAWLLLFGPLISMSFQGWSRKKADRIPGRALETPSPGRLSFFPRWLLQIKSLIRRLQRWI